MSLFVVYYLRLVVLCNFNILNKVYIVVGKKYFVGLVVFKIYKLNILRKVEILLFFFLVIVCVKFEFKWIL